MAKETKFIEVAPNNVNATIEMWQNFGWELVGAPQEINYTTTRRTQETDDHYSSEHTTKTHYVKATFQREKSAPNYAELVDLEERYYSLPRNIPKNEPKKPKRFGVGWIILTVLGIGLYVIPGVVIIIYRYVTHSGKLKNWECDHSLWERRDEIKKEEAEIIKRAKSLTN